VFRLKTEDWPFFCYFIAWGLTLLFILLGMGMVVAYGIRQNIIQKPSLQHCSGFVA
jgi:hypothetical protein